MIKVAYGSEWFYSTLAQTCATIVGLVGAILGSQIIEHLSVMRTERRELLQKINTLYQHFQERFEHWRVFRKYLLDRIERENSIFELGTPALDATPELTWDMGKTTHGHPGGHVGEIFEPEHDLQFLDLLAPGYESLTGEVNEKEIERYASRLKEIAERLPLDSRPAHIVLVDAASLDKLANRVSRFRLRLFPRPFSIILIVLGWLSMTGIVWPLATLPGFQDNWTEETMLITLTLGMLALIGYFAYQLKELSKIGRLYWKKPH